MRGGWLRLKAGSFGGEQREECGLFGEAGAAGGHDAEAGGQAGGIVGRGLDHPLGQSACGLNKLWVVQQDEGLQRRVGALAAQDADLARRGVELLH